MTKKRINVILPKNAVKEIRESMFLESYGLREKSKWISEAIEDFLELKEYKELVEMAELVDELAKTETIHITPELEDKLDLAVIAVRRECPTLDGVKSLIVRASIVRRLIIHGKRKSSD